MPFLRYHDVGTALRWLCEVLGFVEAVRWAAEDGSIGHAELVHGRCVLQIGHTPEPAAADPDAARAFTLVFVDGVDAACARAVAAGGSIQRAAEDQPWGLRQAIVVDPGGYLWDVSQHLRDVPLESWGATLVSPLPG